MKTCEECRGNGWTCATLDPSEIPSPCEYCDTEGVVPLDESDYDGQLVETPDGFQGVYQSVSNCIIDENDYELEFSLSYRDLKLISAQTSSA